VAEHFDTATLPVIGEAATETPQLAPTVG
jgi:hypothetical protein